MPVTITYDNLSDASLQHSSNGYSLTRVLIIEDLSGTATQRQKEALDESPARGAVHPSITSPILYVDTRAAKMLDPETAEVTLTYVSKKAGGSDPEETNAPAYEFSSSSTPFQTPVDRSGNIICTGFDLSSPQQAHVVEASQSTEEIRVVRYEVDINPGDISRQFTDKVNSTAWHRAAGETAAENVGSWKLTDLSASSEDNQITWKMSYTFKRAPLVYEPVTGEFIRTWMPMATHEMPDGKFPCDAEKDAAITLVDWPEYANFNLLNL